jgi:hypothetical protein
MHAELLLLKRDPLGEDVRDRDPLARELLQEKARQPSVAAGKVEQRFDAIESAEAPADDLLDRPRHLEPVAKVEHPDVVRILGVDVAAREEHLVVRVNRRVDRRRVSGLQLQIGREQRVVFETQSGSPVRGSRHGRRSSRSGTRTNSRVR